jgi:ribosome-associated protein
MKEWEIAVEAVQAKQGDDIAVLKIGPDNSFTDYFLICTGGNPRQVQAIADSIEVTLKAEGVRPIGIEGYNAAEWVLMDYGDFVVHIFSPNSRQFYSLERLWKNATRVPLPDVGGSEGRDPEASKKTLRTVPTSH